MKRRKISDFRRRKSNHTDYRKRLSLLKSGKPRLVVRKSLKNIQVQLVNYTDSGDTILASASSTELNKLGWNYSCSNIPAAYLTGLLCGTRSKVAKVKAAVLDTGLYRPIAGSKLYAAAKGASDTGLEVPHGDSEKLSEERLSGAHIASYAETLEKDNKEKYESQFSHYISSKTNPKDIQKQFEATKKKIMEAKK